MSEIEVQDDNTIEVRTMTDEEVVLHWAKQSKISIDSVEKLFKDGFTSMEAIELIDSDDLGKTKIPRGQQKLILASVNKRLNLQRCAVINAPAQQQQADDVEETPIQNEAGTTNAHEHSFDQSATTGNRKQKQKQQQDGGAHEQLPSVGNVSGADAFSALLGSLQTGQSIARSAVTNGLQQMQSGVTLNGSSVNNNVLNQSVDQLPTASVLSHSWKDPQIYLESAATGKSVPTHYDITDFISSTVEEEIIVGGNGSQQVVVKSGPRKPKLENVSLAQWSVANLAILYKLVGEGKLHGGNILDYLSYTTKICQLVQKYTLVSVLLYDREYRQLQARHDFRWGTDVPHFHTIHLLPRTTRPVQPPAGKTFGTASKATSPVSPLTLDGKVICKLFNSKNGCHYKECRFMHQCSVPGCYQYHSAQNHNQSKN